jgi:adenylyl-sulfate kinase
MSDGLTEAWRGTYFKDRSTKLHFLNTPQIFWFTGLPQSGKSTIAEKLHQVFENEYHKSYILDGDVFREGLNKDLGFSPEDRIENLRRAAEVAKIIYNLGYSVFAAFITPSEQSRNMIKNILPDAKFIYVDTPLEICEQRDTRGMYKLARQGKIADFTGVDSPFEIPKKPWMSITSTYNIETISDDVIKKLKEDHGTF